MTKTTTLCVQHHVNFGIAHDVTGPLAFLALARRAGHTVDGQDDALAEGRPFARSSSARRAAQPRRDTAPAAGRRRFRWKRRPVKMTRAILPHGVLSFRAAGLVSSLLVWALLRSG